MAMSDLTQLVITSQLYNAIMYRELTRKRLEVADRRNCVRWNHFVFDPDRQQRRQFVSIVHSAQTLHQHNQTSLLTDQLIHKVNHKTYFCDKLN